MIKETLIKTGSSNRPWFSRRDAEAKSALNRARYSAKAQAKVQKAVDLIDTVYDCKELFVNYREKFVAIKLNQPVARSPYDSRMLDDLLANKGCTKVVSKQGVTYRVYC